MSGRLALRLISTGAIAFGLFLIGTGGSNFAFDFNSWSMWLTVLGLGVLMATFQWLSLLLWLAALVALVMVPFNLSGGSWGTWLLLSGIFLILGLAGIVAGNWDSDEAPTPPEVRGHASTPQATSPATNSRQVNVAKPPEQRFHSTSASSRVLADGRDATSRVLADGRDATSRLRRVLKAADPVSVIQESSPQPEVTSRFCTDCGSPRDANSKFCIHCGAQLGHSPG